MTAKRVLGLFLLILLFSSTLVGFIPFSPTDNPKPFYAGAGGAGAPSPKYTPLPSHRTQDETIESRIVFDGANNIYVTPYGNYTWLQPGNLLRFTNFEGETVIDKSVYVLQYLSGSTWLPFLDFVNEQTVATATGYSYSYDLNFKYRGTNYVVGSVFLDFNASSTKTSVSFIESEYWDTYFTDFRWIWDVVPTEEWGIVENPEYASNNLTSSHINIFDLEEQIDLANVTRLSFTRNGTESSFLDVSDYGAVLFKGGDEPNWNSKGYVAIFPENEATIDPITYTEDTITLEFPASTYTGQWYDINITDLANVPKNCVIEIMALTTQVAGSEWMGIREDGSSRLRRISPGEAEDGGVTATRTLGQVSETGIIEIFLTWNNINYYTVTGYWEGVSFQEDWTTYSVTSSEDDMWHETDGSELNITAERVHLITIQHLDSGKNQVAGVRNTTSSLERKVDMIEDEGSGSISISMFVQSDASSKIDVYTAQYDDHVFINQGYFDDTITFQEDWTQLTVGSDTTWVDNDISPRLDQDGRVCDFFVSHSDEANELEIGVRKNGESTDRKLDIREAEGAGYSGYGMMAQTDNNGVIEAYCEDATYEYIWFAGYFVFAAGFDTTVTTTIVSTDFTTTCDTGTSTTTIEIQTVWTVILVIVDPLTTETTTSITQSVTDENTVTVTDTTTDECVTETFTTTDECVTETLTTTDLCVTETLTTTDECVTETLTVTDSCETETLTVTDSTKTETTTTTDETVVETTTTTDETVVETTTTTDETVIETTTTTDQCVTETETTTTTDETVQETTTTTDETVVETTTTTDECVTETLTVTDSCETETLTTTDECVTETLTTTDLCVTETLTVTDSTKTETTTTTDETVQETTTTTDETVVETTTTTDDTVVETTTTTDETVTETQTTTDQCVTETLTVTDSTETVDTTITTIVTVECDTVETSETLTATETETATLTSYVAPAEQIYLGFDGDNDYLSAPTHNSMKLNSSDATWEWWIQWNNSDLGAGEWYLAEKGIDDAEIGFVHYLSNVSGVIYFNSTIYDGGAAELFFGANVDSYGDGDWHVFNALYNTTSDTVSLYVDGFFIDQSGSQVEGSIDNEYPLKVGGEGTTSGFLGNMSEFKWYARQLNISEIAYSILNVGTPKDTAGLIVWWKIDEGTGDTVADSEKSNDGTLQPDYPSDAPIWYGMIWVTETTTTTDSTETSTLTITDDTETKTLTTTDECVTETLTTTDQCVTETETTTTTDECVTETLTVTDETVTETTTTTDECVTETLTVTDSTETETLTVTDSTKTETTTTTDECVTETLTTTDECVTETLTTTDECVTETLTTTDLTETSTLTVTDSTETIDTTETETETLECETIETTDTETETETQTLDTTQTITSTVSNTTLTTTTTDSNGTSVTVCITAIVTSTNTTAVTTTSINGTSTSTAINQTATQTVTTSTASDLVGGDNVLGVAFLLILFIIPIVLVLIRKRIRR